MQEKTGKRKVRAVMATKSISVGIERVGCIVVIDMLGRLYRLR